MFWVISSFPYFHFHPLSKGLETSQTKYMLSKCWTISGSILLQQREGQWKKGRFTFFVERQMATNKVETLSSNLFIYSPYCVSFTFLILFYNPDLIHLWFTYRKNLENIWNKIFAVNMCNILRFIALATKNGLVERGNIHIFLRNVNCYKPKKKSFIF